MSKSGGIGPASGQIPGRPLVYQVYDNLRPDALTSSPLVDLELHPLLSYIIRDFIANWFTSISGDEELLLEFIKSLSILVRNMEFRLCKVDWVAFLTKDFPEALRIHLSDFKRCKERLNSSYAGSATLEELFHGLQPHIALSSEENEHEYCRKIAEIFLESFFPPKEMDSDILRYLMREVMSESVFISAFDALSEPETIFDLLNSVRFSLSNRSRRTAF
jgi:hypothetical protein